MGGYFTSGCWLVEGNGHTVGSVAVLVVSHLVAIIMIRVRTATLAVNKVRAVVVAHITPAGILRIVKLIAAEEVTAGHGPVLGIAFGVAVSPYGDGSQLAGSTCGPCLVVVVHHVDLTTARSSIAAVTAVVDNAVAEVYILSLHGILPVELSVAGIACVACPVVAGPVEAR